MRLARARHGDRLPPTARPVPRQSAVRKSSGAGRLAAAPLAIPSRQPDGGLGMSKPRAYIVCGPESCGNHLMTGILVRRGASLELDVEFERPAEPFVVWQGSMPKAGNWYSLHSVCDRYRQLEYQPAVLVMSRGWHAACRSQVRHRLVPDTETALANIRRAYTSILADLQRLGCDYVIVSYESLVYEESVYLEWLLATLDVPQLDRSGKLHCRAIEKDYRFLAFPRIVNENEKYSSTYKTSGA